MATVRTPPALPTTPATRLSSFGYSDLYGASDAAGPSSTVAASIGGQSTMTPAATGATQAAVTVSSLHALGHSLIDSPTGIVFLALVAVVLLAIKEATQ